MALPWKTLDRCVIPTEGVLELRQRGADDFLITLDALVLMNSRAQRSEMALGTLGCRGLQTRPAPYLLFSIGGPRGQLTKTDPARPGKGVRATMASTTPTLGAGPTLSSQTSPGSASSTLPPASIPSLLPASNPSLLPEEDGDDDFVFKVLVNKETDPDGDLLYDFELYVRTKDGPWKFASQDYASSLEV